MKVGFYPDDLYDYDNQGLSPKDVAELYADEDHQIDEESDIKFQVYVEDGGVLFEFNMCTEFDPSYYVESIKEI